MSVPSNLVETRVTSLPMYLGSDVNGTIFYVLQGRTYQAQLSTLFAAVGGGTVTSVDVSGGATGLAFTGGPVVLDGTITASGTLNVGHGGTGAATASEALANLLPSYAGHAGQVLAVNGAASGVEYIAPSAGTVTSIDASGGATGLTFAGGPVTTAGTLTLDGTLSLAHGGTGAGNASGARMAILPTYSGNAGKVLAVNAGATDVEYITVSGSGTVTSVNVSGGTTGLSFSGGPVTASGTITASGTLAVANGGTGQTSYTNGQLLIGNTTGNTLVKAGLTPSAGISITNGAGSITVATAITSTGDLLLGNGSNSATRLAIGTNGQVLTSNGTTAAWATPTAVGFTQIGSTLTTTGAGPWDFTSIPTTYSEILLTINMTITGTGSIALSLSPDGVSWSSSVNLTPTSVTNGVGAGGALIPGYRMNNGVVSGAARALASSPAIATGNAPMAWWCIGGITGLRVSISAGTGNPVSIALYGR